MYNNYMIKEIEAIIEKGEYEHYGIRAVASLSDHFTESWLKKTGQSVEPVALTVGQIAPASYRWEDGNNTDEELGGTCAIQIPSAWDGSLERPIEAVSSYLGKQLALLGCYHVSYGEDNGEIIMQDAVVLAIWSR